MSQFDNVVEHDEVDIDAIKDIVGVTAMSGFAWMIAEIAQTSIASWLALVTAIVFGAFRLATAYIDRDRRHASHLIDELTHDNERLAHDNASLRGRIARLRGKTTKPRVDPNEDTGDFPATQPYE
jgi:hypothetical protein